MTELEKLIDEAAKDVSQFCYCAGPTCSGCGPITEVIFKKGITWALKHHPIVRDMAEALEKYAKKDKWHSHQITKNNITFTMPGFGMGPMDAIDVLAKYKQAVKEND